MMDEAASVATEPGPTTDDDPLTPADVLRAVLDASLDSIVVESPDGRLIACNERFRSLWRIPDDVLTSGSMAAIRECVLPQLRDPETFLARVADMRAHPEQTSHDVVHMGDGRVVTRYSAPVTTADNIHIGRVWFARDITASQQAEARLRESEERHRALFHHTSDIIAVMDDEGLIRSISGSVERVLGFQPDEMLGASTFDFVHPDDTPGLAAAMPSIAERPFTPATFRMRHRDGSWRWIESIASDLRDNPSVGGIVINARDVSDRQDVVQALQQLTEQYNRLVNDTTDIIIAFDRAGFFTFVNQRFVDVFGMTLEQARSARITDLIHPDDRSRVRERIAARLRGESVPSHNEFRVLTPAGRELIVESNATPVIGDDGVYIGGQAILRDITERRAVDEELRRREQEFRALAENSPDIIIRFDREQRHVYVNPAITDATGLPPEAFIGKTNADMGMTNELERFLHIHRQRVFDTGQESELEFSYPAPDGTRWYSTRIVPEFAADGTVENILNVARDITTQKKAEESLRLHATIVASSDDAIVSSTLDGSITSWNSGAARLYDVSRMEALGRSITMILPSEGAAEDTAEDHLRLLTRVASGETINHLETTRTTQGDEQCVILLTLTPLRDDSGAVVGVAALGRDISDRKRLENQLAQMALHDPLTGLPNRVLLLDRMQHALATARRHAQAVAVLYLDLDDFKSVNDTLGHIAGDELLMETARRIRSSVREEDTASRMGGDEFIILLNAISDSAIAVEVAQRLVTLLNQPFDIEGREVVTSVSIGIAFSGGEGSDLSDPDALLRAADSAMYHAKRLGKNRYLLYESDTVIRQVPAPSNGSPSEESSQALTRPRQRDAPRT
jgi:diguanylate cyclase (GGDEF)-like protein/PAS domain S-box-containing protein